MTTKLYELTDEGTDLVTDAFMRGDEELSDEEIETAREELNYADSEVDVDVEGLREVFEDVMANEDVESGAADIDAMVAADVRRHLDLTRELAAHDGLWRYLTVVVFPDFVRYRWPYPDPNRSEDSMRDKFLKHSRDIYENALVRLWWIAELTRDGDDYSSTETALSKQELANDVFDRGFARYPSAVRATVGGLADANSGVVSDTTTRLNHALSTIRLESLSEADIQSMIQDIRAEVESER